MTERHFQLLASTLEQDTVTKPNYFYSKFEALEEELAHCYSALHERFMGNPAVAEFWAQAALEEMQHSSVLHFCRERRLFCSDADVDFAMAWRVDDLLNTVKSIVTNPDITIDEAFYAALLIETSELDEAYVRLTAHLIKSHPVVYDAIHKGLHAHHERFANAAAQFGIDRAYAAAFRALGRSEQWVSNVPR